MRAFGIELFDEGIEFSLLLKDVASGGACGFFLQSKMHALVPAVLLRMTGLNALDRDAQPQPPD